LLLLAALQAPDLSRASFEELMKYIVPKEHESKWRQIPWRPVFWDAVVEAQQKDKPILLWGMNGHPLACT
jgi:hypothetical protein